MANSQVKKTIGFIELPDEALDLFGYYAQRPDWEVGLVISLDGQSYAARMAHILKVPLLDRPNRPTLMECHRVIVGKKPGLRAMVKELVEDSRIEIVPVEDALAELNARTAERPALPAMPAPPAEPAAPARGNRPSGKPAAKSTPAKLPRGKSGGSASRANRPSSSTTPRPATRPAPRPAAPPPPPPRTRPDRERRPEPRPTFDAGTILGADFRNKLQSLPLDNGDELLREILELAVKVTHADSGSIMLVDDTGTHLRIAVADGLPKWVITHTRQEVGTGIAGTVFSSGEPRLVHGHVSGREGTSADVRPGLRDAACVPIPGKEGPIGVLNLNVESEGTRFDIHTLSLLGRFAREASSAVLRAVSLKRLTSTMQREVAMRQVERLMSLQETISSRLQSVSEVLGQSLGADYINCLVVDADRAHLEVAGTPKGMGLLTLRKQPIDRGFTGWVLGQETPCVLEAGPSQDRVGIAYLPLGGARPHAVFVFERIPLDRTSAAQVLQFLTEAKEIIEALIALEESTEDLDTHFPPGRARA